MNKNISVKIPCKSASEYPIIIGNDILKDFYEYFKKYSKAKKILVVTNQTVKDLYGKYFQNSETFFVVLEDGEIYKNIKSYEKILNKACEIKLERNDAIVALGGGVIGDMAGFAAATYLRGIDFVQVPTTLLAMVDSSVGGKTGFNNEYGKNLIGAFYQPKFVLADVSTLKTLDKEQIASGFGEVLKYGFIEKNCNLTEDMNFATFLLENIKEISIFNTEIMIKIIQACCKMKSAVVEQDEKEKNLRRILNFGHTIGHAVENALNYKGITHGEAVTIGMKIMFNYAIKTLLIDEIYKVNAFKLIDSLVPVEKIKISINDIKKAMLHDKKSINNKINFVVPNSRREVMITDDINFDILNQEIENFFTN